MPTKKKSKKVTKKVAKKKVTKKKVAKKAVTKKTAKKRAAKSASTVATPKLQIVGEITHYFPHVAAGVIKLSASLKAGEVITIKGHTTNFSQAADSMQIEHVPVTEAKKGDEIGLRVKDRVRIGDIIYKV